MTVKLQTIINIIEQFAPKSLAYEWDNVGLQIGDPRAEVRKVLVALDLTPAVIEEAVANGVDLVVTHHPFLFKPLKQIRFDLAQGANIRKLIKHDLAVYAAHTNLDLAAGGVNDLLAAAIGLTETEVLEVTDQVSLQKLVVFVPETHLEPVRQALNDAGAGWIGNYRDCTFRVLGTGTFRPLAGTNPYLGQVNRLEQVAEYRLETIVPQTITEKVIKAMLKAHPYEEVAYDLIPLANAGQPIGLGRIGRLPTKLTVGELAARVKTALAVDMVRVIGDLDRMISKVAVCGGAGANLIHHAVFKGADLLLTGDVKYHEAQEAQNLGLTVIDAGHYATEQVIVPVLAELLQRELAKEQITIMVSQTKGEPFVFV